MDHAPMRCFRGVQRWWRAALHASLWAITTSHRHRLELLEQLFARSLGDPAWRRHEKTR
jgi:hypothetical protein